MSIELMMVALLRLIQEGCYYDRVGIDGTSIRDLNMWALDAFFQQYEVDFSAETEAGKVRLLTNTDVLSESGTVTVAGLLIFGINPARHLPPCGITFARLAGTEIDGELIDRQNINGTLDHQVNTGQALIGNHIRTPSEIRGMKRVDTRAIPPPKVIRELLVNACVHRNYAIVGSKIRIFLFDDRMSIISPGRLPNTVTVEKLKAGVSYAVNPVIVKFMENLRFIDRLGRGLPMVWREMEKLGGGVEVKEIGEELNVTIWWEGEDGRWKGTTP